MQSQPGNAQGEKLRVGGHGQRRHQDDQRKNAAAYHQTGKQALPPKHLQRYYQRNKARQEFKVGKYFFQGNPRREAQAEKKQHLYRGDNQCINNKNKYGKDGC